MGRPRSPREEAVSQAAVLWQAHGPLQAPAAVQDQVQPGVAGGVLSNDG